MSMKDQPDNWETHPDTFSNYGEAVTCFYEYYADPTFKNVSIRNLGHPSLKLGYEIIFCREIIESE